MPQISLSLPDKIAKIFEPVELNGARVRYRGAKGGRGSAKSMGFGDMLLLESFKGPEPLLCCRELQNSIKDSVHSMLVDEIDRLGLARYFDTGASFIRNNVTGANFIFKGLRSNINEIKSMHNVRIAWIEEAQSASKKSLDILFPTIRAKDSEIWATWNPEDEEDPIEQELWVKKPRNAVVDVINWTDNPFFPDVLNEERLRTLENDPDRYNWIWEGGYNLNSDAAVYGKWMEKARQDGRIRSGLYDPALPVFTAWDLGFSDDTAIWWFQVAGNEIRLIDFYAANREDMRHYAEQIYGREIPEDKIVYGPNGKVLSFELGDILEGCEHRQSYKYGDMYVPHDAANKLLQAGGRSIIQQLFEFGIKTRKVNATSQQNQIEGARRTIGFSWFDPDYCAEGIRCLKKYQFKYDDDKRCYSKEPDHDLGGYSHPCDAYEIIAQVWKSAKLTPPPDEPQFWEKQTVAELFALDAPKEGGYNRI